MNINELIEINHINKTRISNIGSLIREPRVIVPLKSVEKETPAEGILDLLMHPHIRRGEEYNVGYAIKKEYLGKIQRFMDKSAPIEFVFQHFPYKCHNPFETMRRTPDLGEIAFFQRLLDINQTVKQIYEPGVKFTALAEGKTYQNLFGATVDEINTYQSELNDFCQRLGAREVVEIIDFMDLLPNPQEFLDECKKSEKNLTGSKNIEPLIPIMMRSLPIMEKMDIKDLLAIFGKTPIEQLSKNQLEILCRLTEDARGAAVKYLAIMEVKRKHRMIAEKFPEKLYITTLPRENIYAFHPIHRKTRLFPQHGVPILESDKVDIVFFGDILAQPSIYTAVYLNNDTENSPFYYLKGSQYIRK